MPPERTDASAIGPNRGADKPAVAPPTPDPKEAAAAVKDRSGPDYDDKGAEEGVGDIFSFEVDYEDKGRSLRWRGRFRAHVLTLAEKAQVGITRARLTNNTPIDALDAATIQILEMQAHLAVAIDSGPDWWKPNKLRDVNVLHAVYAEVAKYERRFWGPQAG